MLIEFFDKEVKKVQNRFNETYGVMVVCNLNHRQSVILSIVGLSILCRKITAEKSKGNSRADQTDIQQFIKIRNVLNNHFKLIENHLVKRRSNGSSTERNSDDGKSFQRRNSKRVQKM